MASKKKESTGIALLSMYNDEDEEMEDLNEEEQEEEEMDEDRDDDKDANKLDEELKNKDNEGFFASSDNTPQALEDDWSPNAGKFGSLTPQQAQFNASSPMRRRGTVTIVDYGHDEVAMSPETEEGEIVNSGLDADVQTANDDLQEKLAAGTGQTLNTQATQSSGQLHILQTARMSYAVSGLEVAEVEVGVELALEVSKDVDPLAKFLPPPPEEKCSDELQERINKFLALKRAGKSFNAEVRNKKDYRNPDFLVHAVRYQDIDQIGSCFSKDVFDPHGYDKSDYYDEIEADMKREIERKEQEKKKSQKVEFIAVGTQPGIVTAPPKISVPISGVTTGSTGGLHSVATAADAVARDGRQNKKSKWDKVDGDRRNPLPSGAQDSISTVGAHAAILSAANAGAGYTAFAQQRRREAEEKKSSERRRT